MIMGETKEYIKGDKHVHQAGSVMIKFAQYNVPGQKVDWKQQEEKEAEELEKEFADFAEEAVVVDDGDQPTQKRELTAERRSILKQIDLLIAKGDWKLPATEQNMKQSMRQVLGVGERGLTVTEMELSDTLWSLLEHRRGGDALRITFQNLIGYWDEHGLFHKHQGSPSLCKLFFGSADGYSNIDKGRPGKSGVLGEFKSVVPLLDRYLPHDV